jgi:pyrimidine operon attenuation protein/uracil phosphoribosyltransferase
MKVILNAQRIELMVQRLVHSILEDIHLYPSTIIIGIQPRGVFFAEKIYKALQSYYPEILYGTIDNTFYRDDIGSELRVPSESSLPVSLDDRRVLLIDDVLYTGRTIRSAMDALLDYGRPSKIDLMVLIDRRWRRELPIQPQYTGLSVDSIETQTVKVSWKETDGKNEVVMYEK